MTNMYCKTETILEKIMFNLKELNSETCSMKVPYNKEYEEYQKKMEELKDKEFNEEISPEEFAQTHMELIDEYIQAIGEFREEKDKIRIYQKECEKKLCRLLVDYFNEINPPSLTKEINEKERKSILKTMNYKLDEANDETCSETNRYSKEWKEYCRKFDQMFENEEMTDEEADRIHDRILEENKELIEKHKKENWRIEEYQNQCKADALELMFEYIDYVNIPEWNRNKGEKQ